MVQVLTPALRQPKVVAPVDLLLWQSMLAQEPSVEEKAAPLSTTLGGLVASQIG
jgi:hypothetical protein